MSAEGIPTRVLIVRWVKDAAASARELHGRFGLEPWFLHEAGPPILRNLVFRGKTIEMGFREAMVDLGVVTLVLTQPIDPPTAFAKWLAEKPANFAHLILFTPNRRDAETAARRFLDLGVEKLFSSDLGDSIRNIGIDTEELLGLTLEICGGDRSEVFPIDGSSHGGILDVRDGL